MRKGHVSQITKSREAHQYKRALRKVFERLFVFIFAVFLMAAPFVIS